MSTFGSTTPGITTPRQDQERRYGEPEHRYQEGPVARTIEHQTAKLPSDVFLWAAVGSMVASMMLHLSRRREDSMFIGQWAPSFLILGLYNKLVKVAGSDTEEMRQRVQR